MVRRIVAGADKIVPKLKDPRQLMQLAGALITNGMERSANTLEYWGENPRTQADLRPIAETVAQVLDLCSQRAKEQSEALAATFGNNPSQALIKEYTSLDNLTGTAHYPRLMYDYYRALSIDKSDPRRAKIADEAIKGLAEYDANDSQVQAAVRLRIGKLQMAKGDYDSARKTLQSVVDNSSKAIQPEPDITQLFEARYFSALCDLLSRNAEATASDLVKLTPWTEQFLPNNKAIREGAAASLAMMQYRLEVLRSELATDDAAKKAAQDKANTVLQQLAKDRPELRSVIFEQLVKSLPEDAPLGSLDAIMLKALIQQGVNELTKPEGQAADAKAIDRAIASCRETLKRRGQANVDESLLDDAGVMLPQLLEKQGNDTDAAAAYLDYVQVSKNQPNRAAALQNVLAAIARARQADPKSEAADKLLDRALPVAVNDFNRKDLAYDLARRLQNHKQFDQAVAMYQQVPRDDKRLLLAQFFQMESMNQRLVNAPASMDKAARAAESQAITRLAEGLGKAANAAAAGAGNDADRNRYRLIEARARLMVATQTRETKPQEAIQILVGFEDSVQGLPGDDVLETDALSLRVTSQMALGQNAQATQSLLKLLQTKGGDRGAAMIFGLLTKLDADLEVATKAGDKAKVKSLLDARASLSGPLVEWAKTNPDPKIQKYTYRYLCFDADTKFQAAMAESDTATRIQRLRQSLALYDQLLTGENLTRWRATVDPAKVDLKYGDVAVLFAKAKVLFELAEYEQARDRFGRLLEDRKLGTPRIISQKDGEMVSEDNPQYWEATYKLYRCNAELASIPTTPNGAKLLEETRNGLKRLFIREGEGVGGEKWKDQFDHLRRELIPDFKP